MEGESGRAECECDESALHHVCRLAAWLHSLGRFHGLLHLKLVNFIACKLCLKKVYLVKKRDLDSFSVN